VHVKKSIGCNSLTAAATLRTRRVRRLTAYHLLAGLTKQLDELRSSLDPVFDDELAPQQDPSRELERVPSLVSRMPSAAASLAERRDPSFFRRAALGVMHARSFKSLSLANAAEMARASSPRASPGTKSNQDKLVSRLVHAMALFDKYSKVPEEDAKRERDQGIAAKGVKLRRVLGPWEQLQLFKHAGLDSDVTDRMASRALASAEASLDRPSHTRAGGPQDRLQGQMTNRGKAAREGQMVDKPLHLAYVRILAQYLDCDKALLDYEMKHGTISVEPVREDLAAAAAEKTVRLPTLHAAAMAAKTINHLGQLCVGDATFHRQDSAAQLFAKRDALRASHRLLSFAEKQAARKEREAKRERESPKIRLLPMTQVRTERQPWSKSVCTPCTVCCRSVSSVCTPTPLFRTHQRLARHTHTHTHTHTHIQSWKQAPPRGASCRQAAIVPRKPSTPALGIPWLDDTGRLHPLHIRMHPLTKKRAAQVRMHGHAGKKGGRVD
jgi:hypothetical protein